jgi:four helix bundle protein
LKSNQVALDFLVVADNIVEHLPRGRGHLADQLTRASIAIVLNIAEGAGKFSKPDSAATTCQPWALPPNRPPFSMSATD